MELDQINDIISHSKKHSVIGIKQSFEDEGALLEDVHTIRRLTLKNDLILNIKIGGCEARTDIYNSVNLGVDGLISPMVETDFALQKFIESTLNCKNLDLYLLVETKTAFKNLEKILGSPAAKMLNGVILGRSDFVKSYGHDKSYVDNDFVFNKAVKIFKYAKSHNLTTTMGGNISPKSIYFISELKNQNLLDFIETRNVIIDVRKCKDLDESIKSAFHLESLWLEYKSRKYSHLSNEYNSRSELLKERL